MWPGSLRGLGVIGELSLLLVVIREVFIQALTTVRDMKGTIIIII